MRAGQLVHHSLLEAFSFLAFQSAAGEGLHWPTEDDGLSTLRLITGQASRHLCQNSPVKALLKWV